MELAYSIIDELRIYQNGVETISDVGLAKKTAHNMVQGWTADDYCGFMKSIPDFQASLGDEVDINSLAYLVLYVLDTTDRKTIDRTVAESKRITQGTAAGLAINAIEGGQFIPSALSPGEATPPPEDDVP